MMSTESFEFFVQYDHRAAIYGADGLFYRRNNTERHPIDDSTNRMDICENWDGPERLQKNYSKLINCLHCTDDIAAKLYEEGNILTCQLEIIQNETNKIRKNELLLNIIQHSGVNVFDRFITALLDTRQSCLVRLVEEGIDFSIDHVKILQQNYFFLVENVDPMSGLLDRMFQMHSLTKRELEETKTKKSNYKINQELMSLLMRKSYDCFQHFIDALETTNHKYIAEKLKLKNDSIQNAESIQARSTDSIPNSHDESSPSVRRLLDKIKINFRRLPGEMQMCVSLKILNQVYNPKEHCHMSFVKQTIETLHDELNRRIQTFSKNEQNLTSELNGEKQKSKQLMETISEVNKNFRRIEVEKDLLKHDRDLNRDEKHQRDAELRNMKKELEMFRKKMEECENLGKREIENLLRHTSDIEQEYQHTRHNRDLIERENRQISAELDDLRKLLGLDRSEDAAERKFEEIKRCIVKILEDDELIRNDRDIIFAELEKGRNQLELGHCNNEVLKRTISKIEKEKEMTIDDRDKILRENSRQTAELNELRNHLVQCETNIEQLNKKLSIIVLENAKMIEHRDMLSDKQDKFEQENSQLTAELEASRNQAELYERNILELNEQISGIALEKRMVIENQNLIMNENRQLSIELKIMKKRYDEAKLEIREKIREISEIEQEKKTIEENLDLIEIEKKKLETELNELKRQFRMTEKANYKAATDIKNVHSIGTIALKISSVVHGVAWLENKIHIIYQSSHRVHVFPDEEPFDERENDRIVIKRMREPLDMVASRLSRSIFINDGEKRCLWRIQMPSKEISRWKIDGEPWAQSINSSDELIVAVQRDGSFYINVYRCMDGKQIKSFHTVDGVPLVVQLSNRNFISPHWNTLDEVHLINELSIDGTKIIRTFNPRSIESNELEDWWPSHLSIDEDDNIFIVDFHNERVVLLNPRLEEYQVLINRDQFENFRPRRLCYVQEKQMLIVGQDESPQSVSLFHVSKQSESLSESVMNNKMESLS